jgi:hypothetical protein
MSSSAFDDDTKFAANRQVYGGLSPDKIVNLFFGLPVGVVLKSVFANPPPGMNAQAIGAVVQSLSARPESATASDEKKRNRKTGRLIASFCRRLQREGMERRDALRAAGERFARPFSEAEILAKHHSKARTARVEKMRATLIPIWQLRGLSVKQIAARLNVRPQHASRMIAELRHSNSPTNTAF